MKSKLHDENQQKYLNDMPYIVEYEEDGTVDYCLGKSYEDAAKVIKGLLEIKKQREEEKEREVF